MITLAADWRARAQTIRETIENGFALDKEMEISMSVTANCLEMCAKEIEGYRMISTEDYDTVCCMMSSSKIEDYLSDLPIFDHKKERA